MGHYRRSACDRMQDIADSPYSELQADVYGNGGFVAEFEEEIAESRGWIAPFINAYELATDHWPLVADDKKPGPGWMAGPRSLVLFV